MILIHFIELVPFFDPFLMCVLARLETLKDTLILIKFYFQILVFVCKTPFCFCYGSCIIQNRLY